MGKIIIGCWDCQYCGTTRISGELRDCPNCGRPRDKDVKFYVADPENYAKDPEKVNKDPDWLCPFCDSLNSAALTVCPSCGAPRDEKTQNYFENRQKREAEAAKPDTYQKAKADYDTAVQNRKKKNRKFLVLAIVAAFIGLLIFLGLPTTKNLEIASCQWERSVEVEHYQELEESGWSLPQGAYNVTERTELYGYESVFDHYETRTREVAEEVLDGYDVSYSNQDLGNGYFEQVENRTPRYKTVYRTETYQEPVYRSVPIYDTKYYYLIMRWTTDHYETTSGENDEPYFASIPQAEDYREGTKKESYWIVDTKGNRYTTSYEIWKDLKAGQKINATVKPGEIIEVK